MMCAGHVYVCVCVCMRHCKIFVKISNNCTNSLYEQTVCTNKLFVRTNTLQMNLFVKSQLEINQSHSNNSHVQPNIRANYL